MNKLIGISTGIKDVQMAPGNIPCVVINNDFINLCNKFGNTAIVIGPQNDNLEIDASKFDALIISGGGDINPERYNQKIDSKTIRISDNRDFTELNLLKSAEENNVKTLAICRGHQLLNVYKGGTLYQDLKDSKIIIKHKKAVDEEGGWGIVKVSAGTGSIENTIEVSVLEIGRKAKGPNFVKYCSAILFFILS